MDTPYFTEVYTTNELTLNLNALVQQGYEVVSILPAGAAFNGQPQFLVIAKAVDITTDAEVDLLDSPHLR